MRAASWLYNSEFYQLICFVSSNHLATTFLPQQSEFFSLGSIFYLPDYFHCSSRDHP